MSSTEYAHPEALVSTEWVAEHLADPNVRIIESNEDVLLYDTGHIPGAVHVDWRRDLNDQTIRDYLDPRGFAELASRIGITPDTTVVFYGDKSNWWACYALWVFSLFGRKDMRILNGGRDKWISEKRELVREVPKYPQTKYPVPPSRDDVTIRAFYDESSRVR
jgi:thiosulfate/3-mercaptopyruvate sulfurtransferase